MPMCCRKKLADEVCTKQRTILFVSSYVKSKRRFCLVGPNDRWSGDPDDMQANFSVCAVYMRDLAQTGINTFQIQALARRKIDLRIPVTSGNLRK